jgi:hypothetical protein
MSFLYEHEGKVIVSQGDPDPLRCPECATLISGKVEQHPGVPTTKLRCSHCNFHGSIERFRVKWQTVAMAHVLVQLD